MNLSTAEQFPRVPVVAISALLLGVFLGTFPTALVADEQSGSGDQPTAGPEPNAQGPPSRPGPPGQPGPVGHWTRDGDGIFYVEGNVGIGTKNPPNLLSLQQIGTGEGAIFSLRRTATAEPGPGDVFQGVVFRLNPTERVFNLDVGGNRNSRARIHLGDPEHPHNPVTTLGNVGIGTTNPPNLLSLQQVGTGQGVPFSLRRSVTADPGPEDAFQGVVFRLNPTEKVFNLDVGGNQNSHARIHLGDPEHPDNLLTILGNVGIGTTAPGAKLQVSNGNVVFDGPGSSAGAIAVSGAGSRLMWIQDKGALRAGTAEGPEWDAASIGQDSIALGRGGEASGPSSTALGLRARAQGLASVALGLSSEARAQSSIAIGTETRGTGVDAIVIGFQSEARGPKAIAVGREAISSGDTSFALGQDVEAAAAGSMVIGRGDPTFALSNHTPSSLAIGFNSNQPTLFVGPSTGAPHTGRVGIGTDAPARELHVRNGVIEVDRSADSASVILSRTRASGGGGGSSGPFVTYEPLKTFILGVNGPSEQPDDGYFFIGDLHTDTSGGSDRRLIISRTGNVSIGAPEPEEKPEARLVVRRDDGDAFQAVTLRLDPTQGGLFNLDVGGNKNSHARIHLGDQTNPDNIVTTLGSVGIGTVNPGSFKLAVNGKVRAKEIVVETGWSDFVFEDGYRLRSLAEVKQFIEYHGHLPDIPSAAEVGAHGVSLGEMEARLLQKVEEMTLYLLDLDREVRELRAENRTLSQELDTIAEVER